VHSAGAGERLVGVVEFSDFPPAVRELPRVGNAFRVDYEAVAALKPDVIIGWGSGNPPESLQRLRDLGFRVVVLEPAELGDIGTQIAEIGALAGSRAVASESATRFRTRLESLRAASRGATPVNVFLQLSARPYFTVTDRHFIGQGLRLCGGRNIFGDLPGLTAIVSLEAIIEAEPQAIIASDMGGNADDPLDAWRKWRDLAAVKNERLYLLDADLLSRPSERILDGVERMCGLLSQARQAADRRLSAQAP
jgi:iron complex transport system substrate-binding protein